MGPESYTDRLKHNRQIGVNQATKMKWSLVIQAEGR